MNHSGWNPVTGRDAMGAGARPPLSPFGAPTVSPNQPYIPHVGGGPGIGSYPWYSAAYNAFGHAQLSSGEQPQFAYFVPGAPAVAGGGGARPNQPYPSIDSGMPAVQMTNSTGGVGCEPGYNFFFPAETTKCHIFYSEIPPWQLPANSAISFKAAHIPSNTLVSELLKGFGCNNEVAKKNRCIEIQAGGNGRWYKGIQISGADKDMMKKTIKDLGWDKTRTGNPGEAPVVCLWFCKS